MPEYIERENAYKLISEQKEKETGMYSIGRNTGLNIAKSIIHSKEQCPSADVVEVRHGEWLPYPSDAYMKCSICGMEYHKSRMPDVVGYCPNPNCGAKMDGKDDNNG